MKTKRSIIIICVCTIILIICVLISKFHSTSLKEEDLFEHNLSYSYDTVRNCVSEKEDYCEQTTSGNYFVYSYHGNDEIVKDIIDEINEKNKQQKMEDQSYGTIHDAACQEVKDKYKYRYLTTTMVQYLEDRDDIISIAQDSFRYDYCTGVNSSKTDIYIYSKKQKKRLTQPEELFEAFHYSKEEIDEIIVQYAKEYDNREVDPSKIVDYQLAYFEDTQLIIRYKLEDDEEWFFAYNK